MSNLVSRLIKCFPFDATPVYLPYYYPWSTEESWHYTRNAPWRVVTKILEALDAAFPRLCHPNLRIEPVLDASKRTHGSPLVAPGHADIHKQIREINEVRDKLDEGHAVKRFTGFWFMGWNRPSPDHEAECTAEENWLDDRYYAESIQNEPHGIEGKQDAIPEATKIFQNFPLPFFIRQYRIQSIGRLKKVTVGTRIPYHLAERKPFRIEIYRHAPNMPGKKGKKIRTLDEGYTGVSPQGKFANTHMTGEGIPAPMELNGTSVHWDGKDKKNKEVAPVAPDASPQMYKACLVVGATTCGSITITKIRPPVVLTLTGPDTVTKGNTATYTASITPANLPFDPNPTFRWKYTADIQGEKVSVTENKIATDEMPQRTTWTMKMANSGTLEVKTTDDGKDYVRTMNVTVID